MVVCLRALRSSSPPSLPHPRCWLSIIIFLCSVDTFDFIAKCKLWCYTKAANECFRLKMQMKKKFAERIFAFGVEDDGDRKFCLADDDSFASLESERGNDIA